MVTTHALKIDRYRTLATARGLGIAGQPVPQLYFERPLSAVMGACLSAGFVIDALEEPVFPPNSPAKTPFSWENLAEFPPVLAVRARVA